MVGYKKVIQRYKQADERQFLLIWFWQPYFTIYWESFKLTITLLKIPKVIGLQAEYMYKEICTNYIECLSYLKLF